MVGDVSPDLKRDVKKHFVIGPVANREFWDGERASLTINRGPCKLTFLPWSTDATHAKPSA